MPLRREGSTSCPDADMGRSRMDRSVKSARRIIEREDVECRDTVFMDRALLYGVGWSKGQRWERSRGSGKGEGLTV